MSYFDDDRVLLSLGSNLGDRRLHLARAVAALESLPGIELLNVSQLHQTAAWGGPEGQGAFLNASVTLRSRLLSMPDLLTEILAIEQEEGRIRTVVNGPRTLDIDILLCGRRTFDLPTLSIPHVAMHERSFVLKPAAEIAGDMLHPIFNKTIAELAQEVGVDGLLGVIPDRGWHHAIGHTTCQ